MATTKSSQPLNVGDRVKIRYSDWRGRIVESRGPLGPGGMLIYRVRVPHTPKPIYVELGEDQLVAIPMAPKPGLAPAVARTKLPPATSQPKKRRNGKQS